MKFTKMQGIGNDYVYVDCFLETLENPSEVAIRVSNRNYGIGSDGLILIMPSQTCDVRMDMYNIDGSRGSMCGNGARCVAKYAYEHGYVKKHSFTLETLGGVKRMEVFPGADGKVGLISVDMGEPKLTSALSEKIMIRGDIKEFTGVDVGNPHAVYILSSKEEVDALDLERIGPDYERHERFKDRVNSEFISISDRKNIYFRVWERGSGETLACGSGATAAAYAAILRGLVEDEVTVHLKGGDLTIRYDRENNRIFMIGEAVEVFTGEIHLEKIHSKK